MWVSQRILTKFDCQAYDPLQLAVLGRPRLRLGPLFVRRMAWPQGLWIHLSRSLRAISPTAALVPFCVNGLCREPQAGRGMSTYKLTIRAAYYSSMVLWFERRRLEHIYANAAHLCNQNPKSLMFVSIEDDRPLRTLILRKEAKDMLESHRRACLIYQKMPRRDNGRNIVKRQKDGKKHTRADGATRLQSGCGVPDDVVQFL